MKERPDAINAKLKQAEDSAAIVKEVGMRIADTERTMKTLGRKLVEIKDRGGRNNLGFVKQDLLFTLLCLLPSGPEPH